MTFAKGDTVKFKAGLDLMPGGPVLHDYECDFADRAITDDEYDEYCAAIMDRSRVWTIAEVVDGEYALQSNNLKLKYLFPEDDLEQV